MSRAVEKHYDAKPRDSLLRRAESPIIGIRRANNLVKRILLATHGPREGGKLLDLACGRGADLDKWAATLGPAGIVLGIDISGVSVREAVVRYRAYRGPRLPCCHFHRADAADPRLWTQLDGTAVPGPLHGFSTVTCHFALHYMWDTQEHARGVLANAAARLLRGGALVITIVDFPELQRRVRSRIPGEKETTIRNRLMRLVIRDTEDFLSEEDHQDPWGRNLLYEVTLEDAIDACEEPGVRPSALLREAAAAGFRVRAGPQSFAQILQAGGQRALWDSLSEDQREVCNLYAAWVFVKQE